MLRKLHVVSIDDHAPAKSSRRTTISIRKVRTILQMELGEIRHRLANLEEEVLGVVSIRPEPDREAA